MQTDSLVYIRYGQETMEDYIHQVESLVRQEILDMEDQERENTKK